MGENMITSTIITYVDERRPGMTFRLDLESEELLESIIGTKWVAMNADKVYQSRLYPDVPDIEPNTLLIRHDTWKEYKYKFTQAEFMRLVDMIDQAPREGSRDGSGRYPARLLVQYTTRQRREWGPSRMW